MAAVRLWCTLVLRLHCSQLSLRRRLATILAQARLHRRPRRYPPRRLLGPADTPAAAPAVAAPPAPPAASLSSSAPAGKVWKISFRPYPELFARGNDPLRILRELGELGSLTVEPNFDSLPEFKALKPQSCYLAWSLELSGDVAEVGHSRSVRLGGWGL